VVPRPLGIEGLHDLGRGRRGRRHRLLRLGSRFGQAN
jgi:hypothetical protein